MEDKVEEVSLFDNDDKPAVAQAVEDAVVEPTPTEIPDKFRGKALEEVIESYVNLEKEVGRKANEIGDLRKLTDQILQNQAAVAAPQHVEPQQSNEIGFDDFIDQPEVAIDQALARNPRLQRLEESLSAREHDIARNALLSRHTDADAVVGSPEFQQWAVENPTRQKMLQEAHFNNDAASAADLIDMFKTTRQVATQEAVSERDAIAAGDLKKATVETGSVQANTKPMFRRAELIQLKIQDPARYEAMSPEIHLAYAEGRVK